MPADNNNGLFRYFAGNTERQPPERHGIRFAAYSPLRESRRRLESPVLSGNCERHLRAPDAITSFQARQSVAIIVPFRAREFQLNIFLNHMHSFLRGQLLDYRIYVAEQVARSSLFLLKCIKLDFFAPAIVSRR